MGRRPQAHAPQERVPQRPGPPAGVEVDRQPADGDGSGDDSERPHEAEGPGDRVEHGLVEDPLRRPGVHDLGSCVGEDVEHLLAPRGRPHLDVGGNAVAERGELVLGHDQQRPAPGRAREQPGLAGGLDRSGGIATGELEHAGRLGVADDDRGHGVVGRYGPARQPGEELVEGGAGIGAVPEGGVGERGRVDGDDLDGRSVQAASQPQHAAGPVGDGRGHLGVGRQLDHGVTADEGEHLCLERGRERLGQRRGVHEHAEREGGGGEEHDCGRPAGGQPAPGQVGRPVPRHPGGAVRLARPPPAHQGQRQPDDHRQAGGQEQQGKGQGQRVDVLDRRALDLGHADPAQPLVRDDGKCGDPELPRHQPEGQPPPGVLPQPGGQRMAATTAITTAASAAAATVSQTARITASGSRCGLGPNTRTEA